MSQYYEKCKSINWEAYSETLSKSMPSLLVTIAIVSMVLQYSARIGLYTLFIGFIVAIWESPNVYMCIPQMEVLKACLHDRLYFKQPFVRAIVYILLSIITFIDKTFCILAGILMLMNAIFLIFTAFISKSDIIDMMADEETVTALASNKFGTF